MNRKLLDPFKSAALPEAIEEFIEWGIARSSAFNRRGTLLATGTDDGYIILWDFETRSVAKVLPGHSIQQPQEAPSRARSVAVTSLAWSRNGRHLLSGSLDKRVILWDVLKEDEEAKVCEITVSGTVNHVCLSPRKPYKALASLLQTPPVLIDLETKQTTPLPSIDFKENKGQQQVVVNSTATGYAVLSKSGGELFLGQLRGVVTVYDIETQQVLDVIKLPVPVKVMSMSLNRKGTILLMNCSDKVVRMMDVQPRPAGAKLFTQEEVKAALSNVEASRVGSLLQEPSCCMLQLSPITFQNAVEKDNQWRAAVMSQDDEHVAAIVSSKNDHRVYIWDRKLGRLVKILEGPRTDSAHDIAWHPVHSCLVTLTSLGKAYIWSHIWDENWSSFAPDFYELDENVEYVEQEDEFDLNRETAAAKQGGDAEEDACEIDILTKDPMYIFSSDEEDEGLTGDDAPLYWLPAKVLQGQAAAAAADDEERQAGSEEEDESSEEESDENEKQEPEIIDGPRKRKVVRFMNTDDDAEFEELPPAGPRPGRGRGRGRRGRPPKNPPPGSTGTAAAAAPGSGAYGAMGYAANAFAAQNVELQGRPVAYPGNMVAGDDDGQEMAQQQQMYGVWGQAGIQQQQQQQQQQMWPGGR